MYIYRIEHTIVGCGPYNLETNIPNPDSLYTAKSKYSHMDQPSMWNDCSYNDIHSKYSRYDYFCSFSSIEQLIHWFDGWFEALDENCFHLAIYSIDCEYVIEGTYQTLFIKNNATKCDSMSLLDIAVLA